MKLIVGVLLMMFMKGTVCDDSTPKPLNYVCPSDFLRIGNRCYFFSSIMASWQDASFACLNKHSQLLTVNNQWEDEIIKQYLNIPQIVRLNRWIGGIYNWAQKKWIWGTTGEAMTYKGFLTESIAPSRRRWQCVYMSPRLYYRWNYKVCLTKMHYICEAPLTKLDD